MVMLNAIGIGCGSDRFKWLIEIKQVTDPIGY